MAAAAIAVFVDDSCPRQKPSGMKPTTPILVVDDSDGGRCRLRREPMATTAIPVFVNNGHCILKWQWVSRKKPEKDVV